MGSYSIVVPCSDRKRFVPTPGLMARSLSDGDLWGVASEWVERLNCAPPQAAAQNMYCGRSISEATKACNILDANFFVCSAGLGIVSGADAIPAYSLTVSPRSEDAVERKVIEGAWYPHVWWEAIRELHSGVLKVSDLLPSTGEGLCLMALSENYARMLREELEGITKDQAKRLRIFGLLDVSTLPEHLAECWMPYDRRLNDPSGPVPGTMSDFSARALGHFARALSEDLVSGVTPESDARDVNLLLQGLSDPVTPARNRLSDEEVKMFIVANWDRVGGRSQAMLRHLRDSNFACEQGRFRGLFWEAREDVLAGRRQRGE